MLGVVDAFASLEGLRLISSVAIVALHFLHYLSDAYWIEEMHVAVDLFFVISGIVIANAYLGRVTRPTHYGDFLRRRIARLYPLHLATLAFYGLIGGAAAAGLLHVGDSRQFVTLDFLRHLTLTHAWFTDGTNAFNYVSWSISAEFFAYLLFPVVALCVASRPLLGLVAVTGFYAVAIGISHAVVHQTLVSLNWKLGALRAVPSFALGIWLAAHRHLVVRLLPARLAAPLIYAAFAALALAIAFETSDYLHLALVTIIVAASFACDLQGRRTLLSRPLFSRGGYLTYSIYMVHPLVATVLISFLFPKLLGVSLLARAAGVALSVPVVFAAAILSYRYFERPMRDILNKARLPRLGARPLRPPALGPGSLAAASDTAAE